MINERNARIAVLRSEAATSMQATVASMTQQYIGILNNEIEAAVSATQKACDDHLVLREEELSGRIQELEASLEKLREELFLERAEKAKAQAQTEKVVELLGHVQQRNRQKYAQPLSLNRIFHIWRQQLIRHRRCKVIDKVVHSMQSKLQLSRSFSAMTMNFRREKFLREQADLAARYSTLHSSVSAFSASLCPPNLWVLFNQNPTVDL